MKMKRVVSMLLAGAMALSLVACGSAAAPAPAEPAAEPAAEATAEEPAAEPAAEEPAAEGPVTLEMWCIATESDSNRHAYEEAIKEIREFDDKVAQSNKDYEENTISIEDLKRRKKDRRK